MHMMHPAFISTRAAATQGGARAAAVVHGAVVGRRCVGCREGRLRPAPWRSVPASSPPSSLCVTHALSSVLSRTFSWPDICHGFLRKAGKLRGNLHSLGSVSRQSCCSSSSRSPAHGRGDPGHGPSPFRSMSIRNSTRKYQTLGSTGRVSDLKGIARHIEEI